MPKFFFSLLCLLLLSGAALATPADTPLRTQHGNWAAFTATETDPNSGAPAKVCYAASRPTARQIAQQGTQQATPTSSTETFIYIIQRPNSAELDVFHYRPNFALTAADTISATIGNDRFKLYGTEGGAWARTAELDRALVNAIRRGRTLSITVTNSAGRTITDRFSLQGSTAAHTAARRACGLGE